MRGFSNPARTMNTPVILTDRNANRVAEYAELVGWTPERLVNRLLAERLDEFDDVRAGSLERFLGSIDYDNRKSADRCSNRASIDRFRPIGDFVRK
jgi:hypothetical protein